VIESFLRLESYEHIKHSAKSPNALQLRVATQPLKLAFALMLLDLGYIQVGALVSLYE
jgi:hypothetical protein